MDVVQRAVVSARARRWLRQHWRPGFRLGEPGQSERKREENERARGGGGGRSVFNSRPGSRRGGNGSTRSPRVTVLLPARHDMPVFELVD
jgi:hypothetical protein